MLLSGVSDVSAGGCRVFAGLENLIEQEAHLIEHVARDDLAIADHDGGRAFVQPEMVHGPGAAFVNEPGHPRKVVIAHELSGPVRVDARYDEPEPPRGIAECEIRELIRDVPARSAGGAEHGQEGRSFGQRSEFLRPEFRAAPDRRVVHGNRVSLGTRTGPALYGFPCCPFFGQTGRQRSEHREEQDNGRGQDNEHCAENNSDGCVHDVSIHGGAA